MSASATVNQDTSKPAGAPAAAPPAINPWLIAVAVMCATFMEVLDTTVVNVSLPHIAGDLGATTDEATWALTSYLVANAIILPLTGWLANYFGRKRLLMSAVIGFTAASVLCGLSQNLLMLIVFRIIQGATGGALQPLSQAVMLEAFPPRERGKAMSFWGLGIVVAPMLGPVLGGWLTDSYSWRWVFYINLPVGLASILMTRMFIFDPPYIKRGTSKIDRWGIGLLALGIGGLQIMLDKGEEEDWFSSRFVNALLVLAIIGIIGFIIRELMARNPVVNLKVFKVRSYSTGVLLMTTLGFVLYGSLVMLPLFLQELLGYPALQAGIAMFPRGLGSFIGMPLTGMLLARVDPRKLLAVGIAGGSFTLLQLSWLNLNAGYWDIFWPQFVQGLSLSLVFVPLTTVTMDAIPREQMGNATSLFNFMRNVGGSMGIAIATTLVSRYTQKHINYLGTNVTSTNPQAQQMLNGLQQMFQSQGLDAVTANRRAYGSVFGMIMRQATMLSFVDTFRLMAGIFLLMIPLLFLLRRPKHQSGPVAAH